MYIINNQANTKFSGTAFNSTDRAVAVDLEIAILVVLSGLRKLYEGYFGHS
jgi:hypothetical protein